MGPRLARVLGGRTSTCHVLDAKYEPGVRATVLYEYAGGCVRGDLVPDGEVPAARTGRAGGPTRAPVVAPGLRISVFPDDPDLPSLRRVMAPGYLGPALADALPDTASVATSHLGVRCRTALIRYRPGRRVTFRVDLVGWPGGYVAKVYHDPRKGAAVAEEAPALAVHADGCATLRVPPTVAHLPADRLVVQRAVTGVPLEALLGRPPLLRGRGRRRDRGHRSHSLGARRPAPDAPGHRAGAVGGRGGGAVRAPRGGHRRCRPAGGRRVRALAERLRVTQRELPGAVTGVVHGDCKPSQVLLDHQQVLLMDLDHVAVADQAMDVGTFLASLRQLPLRRPGTGSRRGRVLGVLRSGFLASYLQAREDDSMLPRIAWQEAVALERKALRAWARAPGSPLAHGLVREAEACLDRLGDRP